MGKPGFRYLQHLLWIKKIHKANVQEVQLGGKWCSSCTHMLKRTHPR